jgi:hypothetical protein
VEVLEQKPIDDLVFPQDVPLGTKDGKQVRYGGLTKHELFSAMFIAATIQRAGIPPSAEAAESLVNGCTILAWAAVATIKEFKPPSPEDESKPKIHRVS